MDDRDRLRRWVRSELDHGTPKETIRGAAVRAGWSVADIDAVLDGVTVPQEDETGLRMPGRLSLALAGIVLLILVGSVVAGVLLRAGVL